MMGYVMFWIGFVSIVIVSWYLWKDAKQTAWEEGFEAGRNYGVITVICEEVEKEVTED